MSGWSLDAVRARLSGRVAQAAASSGGSGSAVAGERPAAVAIVLRYAAAGAVGGADHAAAAPDPHVLLMKRADRAGDPWSGHVSFPGGRFEAGDADLRATAIRETREELGIDLAGAGFLGALEPIVTTGRSTRPLPATAVAPFVFVETAPLAPVPGPEATSVFWLPIARAAAGAFDGELQYNHLGVPMTFPCWNYEGYVVWGMTFRMLRTLIETVAETVAPP
jgi:8-oxo-dGTP pyrophosphatase MutT (NUDIX family)